MDWLSEWPVGVLGDVRASGGIDQADHVAVAVVGSEKGIGPDGLDGEKRADATCAGHGPADVQTPDVGADQIVAAVEFGGKIPASVEETPSVRRKRRRSRSRCKRLFGCGDSANHRCW